MDKSAVSFLAPVLATAPSTTLTWLSGKPAVLVAWDPNACDPIELPSGGPDWVSAGLLIRGASLDGQNRLQLATGVSIQDLDMVDIDPTGKINEEYFLPDDAALVSFPQLLQPVLTAKQLVLQLAKP